MAYTIRPLQSGDVEAVVEFSLRAWAPVFDSMRAGLGEAIFLRLYPNWREDQARAVRSMCEQHAAMTWTAVVDGAVAGFATVVLHEGSPIGEVTMLAVDPDHQRRGIGRALTEFAVDRIRDADRTVAMIGTGGDPGHAPARATYAAAGLTPLPIVRYFKTL